MSRSFALRFPVPPWRYRLATAAEQRMGDFNPQALVNTAWAFATASQKDALLFAALATTTEQHMGDFNPQELANTALAFASVDIQKLELMRKVSAAASLHIEQFDSVDLLKFLRGCVWVSGKDELWANAVASLHMRKYAFASISLDVALTIDVPRPLRNAAQTHVGW